MREGAFSKLGSQPWCHVLTAGSRSQASTRCSAAGRTDDVFEIRRASASVYSVHDQKFLLICFCYYWLQCIAAQVTKKQNTLKIALYKNWLIDDWLWSIDQPTTYIYVVSDCMFRQAEVRSRRLTIRSGDASINPLNVLPHSTSHLSNSSTVLICSVLHLYII